MCSFENWGMFCHVRRLDQLLASENIWIIMLDIDLVLHQGHTENTENKELGHLFKKKLSCDKQRATQVCKIKHHPGVSLILGVEG